MRILTTIAGILICGTGAFCFAVNMNVFADVAFLVGLTMMIAGVLLTFAYLVSGRGENRLTETALVEGVVSFFYGFAVINDQVTDLTLTMFFGTWLTLCGISRVSQSFYVSRFNRKDWAKILPLGIVASVLGIVMMMPALVKNIQPLMLIGGVMILDGLSMLIFAMFMRRSDADPGRSEAAAKERSAAKKAMIKARREQRDRLRNLSKEEREAEQAKIREQRKALEDSKRRERDDRRQARKDATAVSSRNTIALTKTDISEIVSNAPKEQLEEDAQAEKKQKSSSRSGIKLPDVIPHIHFSNPREAKKKEEKTSELNLSALNLKEIEENTMIEFQPVEVSGPELESDKTEVIDRADILQSIEEASLPEADVIDYAPIVFDDPETDDAKEKKSEESKPEEADDRWTQILNFNWKEVEIKED